MSPTSDSPVVAEYVLPTRRFCGTREEVVVQLDEVIETLVAVRQMLTRHNAPPPPPPPPPPRRRFRLLRVGLALAQLFGSAMAAGGQTVNQPRVLSSALQEAASQTPSPQETDPWEHVRFGVTLEGYYQFNGNRPYDRVTLLRAYDQRANVLGIQQAAIVVESAPNLDAGRRFGARVDLQFGQATETVQGSAANEPRPDVYRNIWQAYGTYIFPLGSGLQADFGKFGSMLGYETNYAKDNIHFSRAYLFNFLPFYHSGLRLTLPAGNSVTLLYMLTNGVQQTEDFNNFKSNHVAAIVKPTTNVTWTVNYYFGQEQPDEAMPNGPDGFFRVFDTYVSYSATPRLSFAVDANYVTNERFKADESLALQGTGVYARYQVSDPVGLSVRYERLDDEGLFGGLEQVLHEVTATAEYKFADGFLVRGELRRDWSDQEFFTTRTPSVLRPHQNTGTIGLVWWFGNKQGAW